MCLPGIGLARVVATVSNYGNDDLSTGVHGLRSRMSEVPIAEKVLMVQVISAIENIIKKLTLTVHKMLKPDLAKTDRDDLRTAYYV
jgi:hypothetical protein